MGHRCPVGCEVSVTSCQPWWHHRGSMAALRVTQGKLCVIKAMGRCSPSAWLSWNGVMEVRPSFGLCMLSLAGSWRRFLLWECQCVSQVCDQGWRLCEPGVLCRSSGSSVSCSSAAATHGPAAAGVTPRSLSEAAALAPSSAPKTLPTTFPSKTQNGNRSSCQGISTPNL